VTGCGEAVIDHCVIIHESFHRFQINYQVNPEDIKIPDYTDLKMSKNLYLEAILLHDALVVENIETKKELVRMFLAVRNNRREGLDTGEVNFEQLQEWKEGTAFYVDRKALIMLDEIKYKTRVLNTGFSDFHGFSLKNDLERMIFEMLKAVGRNIDLPILKCYYFGMAQCFLLDQLEVEDWKKSLLSEMKYPETLLSEYCDYSDIERNTYLNEALKKYKYIGRKDEIVY